MKQEGDFSRLTVKKSSGEEAVGILLGREEGGPTRVEDGRGERLKVV